MPPPNRATEEALDRSIEDSLRKVAAEAHALAQAFHSHYERLAPVFGYQTRPESRTAWEEVPIRNRALMVFTAAEVIQQFDLDVGVES